MRSAGKSFAKELVRQRTGRDVPDVLRELYVDRRHSAAEIAQEFGVSRELIGKWLQEYGISRADRAPIELGAAAQT